MELSRPCARTVQLLLGVKLTSSASNTDESSLDELDDAEYFSERRRRRNGRRRSLVSVPDALCEKFECGVLVAELIGAIAARKHGTNARAPLDAFVRKCNAVSKAHNWNLLTPALATCGVSLDPDMRALIVAGDVDVVADVVEALVRNANDGDSNGKGGQGKQEVRQKKKRQQTRNDDDVAQPPAAETPTPTPQPSASPSKLPPIKAGGNNERGAASAVTLPGKQSFTSCQEYLAHALQLHFGISRERARELLTTDVELLADWLSCGTPPGQFRSIRAWLGQLTDDVMTVAALFDGLCVGGASGAPVLLSLLATGLAADDRKVNADTLHLLASLGGALAKLNGGAHTAFRRWFDATSVAEGARSPYSVVVSLFCEVEESDGDRDAMALAGAALEALEAAGGGGGSAALVGRRALAECADFDAYARYFRAMHAAMTRSSVDPRAPARRLAGEAVAILTAAHGHVSSAMGNAERDQESARNAIATFVDVWIALIPEGEASAAAILHESLTLLRSLPVDSLGARGVYDPLFALLRAQWQKGGRFATLVFRAVLYRFATASYDEDAPRDVDAEVRDVALAHWRNLVVQGAGSAGSATALGERARAIARCVNELAVAFARLLIPRVEASTGDSDPLARGEYMLLAELASHKYLDAEGAAAVARVLAYYALLAPEDVITAAACDRLAVLVDRHGTDDGVSSTCHSLAASARSGGGGGISLAAARVLASVCRPSAKPHAAELRAHVVAALEEKQRGGGGAAERVLRVALRRFDSGEDEPASSPPPPLFENVAGDFSARDADVRAMRRGPPPKREPAPSATSSNQTIMLEHDFLPALDEKKVTPVQRRAQNHQPQREHAPGYATSLARRRDEIAAIAERRASRLAAVQQEKLQDADRERRLKEKLRRKREVAAEAAAVRRKRVVDAVLAADAEDRQEARKRAPQPKPANQKNREDGKVVDGILDELVAQLANEELGPGRRAAGRRRPAAVARRSPPPPALPKRAKLGGGKKPPPFVSQIGAAILADALEASKGLAAKKPGAKAAAIGGIAAEASPSRHALRAREARAKREAKAKEVAEKAEAEKAAEKKVEAEKRQADAARRKRDKAKLSAWRAEREKEKAEKDKVAKAAEAAAKEEEAKAFEKRSLKAKERLQRKGGKAALDASLEEIEKAMENLAEPPKVEEAKEPEPVVAAAAAAPAAVPEEQEQEQEPVVAAAAEEKEQEQKAEEEAEEAAGGVDVAAAVAEFAAAAEEEQL